MMQETVRAILKRRDGLTDDEVDEALEEFKWVLQEGTDPEEAMADVFGLEPDYLFSDAEVYGVLEQALR